jgi:hypothetical protein
MPARSAAERSLIASIASETSWAFTPDRAARTEPARERGPASLGYFEVQVDPNGDLDPAVRAARADNLRRAYFKRLALKSAQARRTRSVVA